MARIAKPNHAPQGRIAVAAAVLTILVSALALPALAAFIPGVTASIDTPSPDPVPAGSTASTSATFFLASDTGPINVAIELQADPGFGSLRLDAAGTSSELTSCVETTTRVSCDWDGDSTSSPQTLAVFVDVDASVLPYSSANLAAIVRSVADGAETYANAWISVAPPVGSTSLSGQVITSGGAPVDQACIFLLASPSFVFQAVTDANGDWSIGGLPDTYEFVVAAVPPFVGTFGPCAEAGPPPVPGPGELQPVFFNDIWIDLADPDLTGGGTDPFDFAVAAGATPFSSSASGVSSCLSTAPSTQVPRPPCITPATTTSTTTTIASTSTTVDVGGVEVTTTSVGGVATLPFTGSNVPALLAAGSALILLGLGVLGPRGRRRLLDK